MVAFASSQSIFETVQIPYVTAEEAHLLLRVELERFIALMKSLGPDDWGKPTACTAWSVRDILAHQAGGYASGTGYRELIHQYTSIPRRGQLPEDAVNATQLSDRSGKSPDELIAELESVGFVAAQKWAYQFQLIKLVTIPHAVTGSLSIRHLMLVIHSRDTWMHRLDICRAAGRKFEQTADHDGRIAALVMRDVAKVLAKKVGQRSVLFELSGTPSCSWKIGLGEPAATVKMDVLDFNIYASRRSGYEEARAQASLSGDVKFGEMALKNALALY
jgi:uncharacterized protein (TIGR03083 family)